MESRRNSSGTFSQDSTRCSSAVKAKIYCTDWEISQEEFLSCRCSTTFLVEQETMNKNVWQTLDSYLCMQEDLVKGNFPGSWKKSDSIKERTVHNESWTILRRRCWWNWPKADVPFSVLRLHCPDVNSETKDTENCRFTLLPLRQQMKLFFAWLFLQISSVFTEQSRKCVKNTNPFPKESGDLMWWCNNRAQCDQDRSFFGNLAYRNFLSNNKLSQQDTLSKFLSFVVENGQYFVTKEHHHNRKDGPREHQNFAPYWKLLFVACEVNTELRSEICLWT